MNVENIKKYIQAKVHHLYYSYDTNCARTTLHCLGHLLETEISNQTWIAAIGLHGAGGYRAQCGLVEGTLMFIGIYGTKMGLAEADIVNLCYEYADEFSKKFGSLRCRELRPGGFNEDDPPHMCEKLTCETIEFAYEFLMRTLQNSNRTKI